MKDKCWRGADGAASVVLEHGKVLWLFSDTFIDTTESARRANATLIRNSVAVQHGRTLSRSKFRFYFKGTKNTPDAFFRTQGDHWLWTGTGIIIKGVLYIFLIEEKPIDTGFGFEAVGWRVAVIENPKVRPSRWRINYLQGSGTFDVIIGSSALLQDDQYLYAYGVREPETHEVYLLRIEIDKLSKGDFSALNWWTGDSWSTVHDISEAEVLFTGQTEFSVHYDEALNSYFQVQTFGFGQASLGYRTADSPQGPWSEPTIFYTPQLSHAGAFVYTANAHPELSSDNLIISYNVNTNDFQRLLRDETLYFPKFISLNLREIR